MNRTRESWMVLAITLVALGIAGQPAYAQQSVRSDAGYVDLDRTGNWTSFFNRDPKIDVSVEGALMNLVAEASRMEDPELADLLLQLKGVYVRGFETRSTEVQKARAHADEVGRLLLDRGWNSVIRVRNEDEHFQMFARYKGDRVSGMVVLSVNTKDRETMFVNIVGNIDPAQIGRIGQKFNIGDFPDRK